MWPIAALLLSLFVQVVVAWAGRSRARSEIQGALRSQRREIRKLHPEDRALLKEQVKAARALAREDKIDEAKKDKATIDTLVEWLKEVRALVGKLEANYPR